MENGLQRGRPARRVVAWSGVTALVLCGLCNPQPLMSEPFTGAWGQDSNRPAKWNSHSYKEGVERPGARGLAAWVLEERMGSGEGEAWGQVVGGFGHHVQIFFSACGVESRTFHLLSVPYAAPSCSFNSFCLVSCISPFSHSEALVSPWTLAHAASSAWNCATCTHF